MYILLLYPGKTSPTLNMFLISQIINMYITTRHCRQSEAGGPNSPVSSWRIPSLCQEWQFLVRNKTLPRRGQNDQQDEGCSDDDVDDEVDHQHEYPQPRAWRVSLQFLVVREDMSVPRHVSHPRGIIADNKCFNICWIFLQTQLTFCFVPGHSWCRRGRGGWGSGRPRRPPEASRSEVGAAQLSWDPQRRK